MSEEFNAFVESQKAERLERAHSLLKGLKAGNSTCYAPLRKMLAEHYSNDASIRAFRKIYCQKRKAVAGVAMVPLRCRQRQEPTGLNSGSR